MTTFPALAGSERRQVGLAPRQTATAPVVASGEEMGGQGEALLDRLIAAVAAHPEKAEVLRQLLS